MPLPQSFLAWSGAAAVLLSLTATVLAEAPAAKKASERGPQWVFLGTYTGAQSKGIYRCQFDPATGKLTTPELAAETTNPTFLAIHPSHRFLYAVSEVNTLDGKKTGGVTAFALDPATGKLTRLNQQPSRGTGPCHLIVDKMGKHVLVANYGGGSAAVLPIGEDGKLAEATGFQQHKGTSVNPARQEAPHAHSINLDANNRYAVVCDLGLDKVFVYKYDADKGTITPNDPPAYNTEPGAGPRHFAFHPNGKWAYVINELNMTLSALSYDAEHGVLKKLQTVSTLPAGVTGKDFSTAEVVVHPSGKFVYGSNRGQNTIAIFRIDAQTGELTSVGHQGMDVKTPRNFNIDPTGNFMVVGNQNGDSVVVFKIDQKTGELQPTGIKEKVGAPVCVKFVPIRVGAGE